MNVYEYHLIQLNWDPLIRIIRNCIFVISHIHLLVLIAQNNMNINDATDIVIFGREIMLLLLKGHIWLEVIEKFSPDIL